MMAKRDFLTLINVVRSNPDVWPRGWSKEMEGEFESIVQRAYRTFQQRDGMQQVWDQFNSYSEQIDRILYFKVGVFLEKGTI